jgi:hypothetical protein
VCRSKGEAYAVAKADWGEGRMREYIIIIIVIDYSVGEKNYSSVP